MRATFLHTCNITKICKINSSVSITLDHYQAQCHVITNLKSHLVLFILKWASVHDILLYRLYRLFNAIKQHLVVTEVLPLYHMYCKFSRAFYGSENFSANLRSLFAIVLTGAFKLSNNCVNPYNHS